jgi:signal transduction histidine kinase/CheY-like chemotaxis protein
MSDSISREGDLALDDLVQDYRHALDQSTDGLLIVEAAPLEGAGPAVVHVNQGLLFLTGWAMEDLVGQPLQALVPQPALADFLSRLSFVGQTNKRYHLLLPVRKADGRTETFRWLLRAGSRDTAGKVRRYIFGLRKQEQTPPAQTSDIALRSARLEALAQVATGIAHDFKNAVFAVKANVGFARDAATKEERDTHVEEAIACCETAAAFAQRLLRFARGAGGGKRDLLDPVTIAHEAIRMASVGSNVRCNLHAPADVGRVEADPVQLVQVLTNLLINARQAMPGGGTVEVEVAREEVERGTSVDLIPGKYISWTVRDRGTGIAENDLARVFEPYYTTKKEGTGIGLSTSLAIAREHGGNITATSRQGVGSTFTVHLPLAESKDDSSGPISIPPVEPEIIASIPGSGDVVLVDDHDSVRMAMKHQIEAHGYKVHTGNSGLDGVRVYRQILQDGKRPLAVFLDLTFPGGMTGEEAAQEILAHDPSAFIVAFSGLFSDCDDEEPPPGFQACLSKPFTRERLVRVLSMAARKLRLASPFTLA